MLRITDSANCRSFCDCRLDNSSRSCEILGRHAVRACNCGPLPLIGFVDLRVR